jgi:hypothetical protein
VIIAAAAAKPMTVLRIVLTPLWLEKRQPLGGNTAIPVALPRAAIGVRGGRPPWSLRDLLLDHERRGLYGADAELIQGFLARVSGVAECHTIFVLPATFRPTEYLIGTCVVPSVCGPMR